MGLSLQPFHLGRILYNSEIDIEKESNKMRTLCKEKQLN